MLEALSFKQDDHLSTACPQVFQLSVHLYVNLPTADTCAKLQSAVKLSYDSPVEVLLQASIVKL